MSQRIGPCVIFVVAVLRLACFRARSVFCFRSRSLDVVLLGNKTHWDLALLYISASALGHRNE